MNRKQAFCADRAGCVAQDIYSSGQNFDLPNLTLPRRWEWKYFAPTPLNEDLASPARFGRVSVLFIHLLIIRAFVGLTSANFSKKYLLKTQRYPKHCE